MGFMYTLGDVGHLINAGSSLYESVVNIFSVPRDANIEKLRDVNAENLNNFLLVRDIPLKLDLHDKSCLSQVCKSLNVYKADMIDNGSKYNSLRDKVESAVFLLFPDYVSLSSRTAKIRKKYDMNKRSIEEIAFEIVEGDKKVEFILEKVNIAFSRRDTDKKKILGLPWALKVINTADLDEDLSHLAQQVSINFNKPLNQFRIYLPLVCPKTW